MNFVPPLRVRGCIRAFRVGNQRCKVLKDFDLSIRNQFSKRPDRSFHNRTHSDGHPGEHG
jgi:hypothetical protein